MIHLKHGEKINFLEEELLLHFAEQKFLKHRVVKHDNYLKVFQSEERILRHSHILEEWLRKEAKRVIAKRVATIAGEHEFEYFRLSVRDQSSRWGSCSSDKNLNFNWRLSFAPLKVMDYVIIHELAHTIEMNHAKAFWDVVARVMPDYKEHRRWLKSNEENLLVKH